MSSDVYKPSLFYLYSVGSEMTLSFLFKKHSKEDSGSYRLVGLTFVSRKAIEKISWEALSSRMKSQKGTGNSQHKATRGKPCLTNTLAFHDEKTGCADQVWAASVVRVDLSKDFARLSRSDICRHTGEKWMKWQGNIVSCLLGCKWGWAAVQIQLEADYLRCHSRTGSNANTV